MPLQQLLLRFTQVDIVGVVSDECDIVGSTGLGSLTFLEEAFTLFSDMVATSGDFPAFLCAVGDTGPGDVQC